MPIHKKVFYLGILFIGGIFAAAYQLSLINIFIGLSFFLFLIFKDLRTSFILFLIFLLGIFYLNFYENLNRVIVDFSESGIYEGEVVSKPEDRLNFSLLEVNLDDPYSGKVRVYTEPGTRIKYGETIIIEGKPEETDRGSVIFSFPKNIIISESAPGSLRSFLFDLRDSLIENIEKVIPSSKSSLAAGILFGERTSFTRDFEESMRKSGTTHIVALSGYNVAVIVVILSSIFGYLLSRRWAFYMSLGSIPIFVMMTGAEPSVVRAAIMGLIVITAENLGRNYSFKNALVLTASGMLVYDPTLIKSLSFQLSFAALMGIVYIYPWLVEKLKVETEGFLSWKKNALQTLSAQLSVTPIILLTFGEISLTALIANTLILEFIPLTMLFSFLVAVLGFISFPVSQVIGWGLNLLLSYEVFIIEFFGSIWS